MKTITLAVAIISFAGNLIAFLRIRTLAKKLKREAFDLAEKLLGNVRELESYRKAFEDKLSEIAFTSERVSTLERDIEDKLVTLDHWRAEALKLQAKIEKLTPKRGADGKFARKGS